MKEHPLRKYLSYGGGVNSTAMLLLLLDEGWEFESIYVDHGCDWPETREFVRILAKKYPITILQPSVTRHKETFDNIYDFSMDQGILPSRMHRWCTQLFKVQPILDYVEKPSIQLIGIDAGEDHRMRGNWNDELKNEYPLVDRGIDRNDCIKIIKDHGIEVPMKSGCWFCPFQRISQWKKLRVEHPELFCKAKTLENRVNAPRKERGYKPFWINKVPLDAVVNEAQVPMWPESKPPCSCGL